MFKCIKMLDFRTPLAERLKSRKFTSGYYFNPSLMGERHASAGFYQSPKGMRIDERGSTFRLRLESANDRLQDRGYGSLARIDGYYCDEHQDETLAPIIARLPKGRGFLAGWTMGGGMCASLFLKRYADAEEAARAAHHEADLAAEREREHALLDRESEDVAA